MKAVSTGLNLYLAQALVSDILLMLTRFYADEEKREFG